MYDNFKKTKNFNKLTRTYKVSKNEKSLEKKEEYELIYKWQNYGDKKSLNRLLGAYKKLVVSFSKRYLGYGLPQEDLINEGMLGLINAINKFEISKGFRLSTYSMWWIKAMMQDYVMKNWSIVKNGNTAAQKALFFNFNKIKKLINHDSSQYMGIDEVKKISEILNIKTLDIENLESRLRGGDKSLNQKVYQDNDKVELISLLKDESPNLDAQFEKKNDNKLKQKWIYEAINHLNKREKFIISERKLNDKPQTLDKIGRELKISKERVRQIEANSLKKLKKIILEISEEPKNFFIN